MRSIITEDISTKIRTTRTLSFTKKGLISKIYNEPFTTETSVFNDDAVNNIVNDNINSPKLVNYNHDKSVYGDITKMYYDCAKEIVDDGKYMYTYNPYVSSHFDLELDIDNIGMTEGCFYLNHVLRDVTLYAIHFEVIDPYSEGANMIIDVGDCIYEEYVIAPNEERIFSPDNMPLNVEGDIGERIKFECHITNNSNVNARGKLKLYFATVPEHELYGDEDEQVNEDA